MNWFVPDVMQSLSGRGAAEGLSQLFNPNQIGSDPSVLDSMAFSEFRMETPYPPAHERTSQISVPASMTVSRLRGRLAQFGKLG